jgi:hypothetical protein
LDTVKGAFWYREEVSVQRSFASNRQDGKTHGRKETRTKAKKKKCVSFCPWGETCLICKELSPPGDLVTLAQVGALLRHRRTALATGWFSVGEDTSDHFPLFIRYGKME